MLRAAIALGIIALSLWVLETARSGVAISTFEINNTPVTQYSTDTGHGSVVIIAHGFAGSQQMMQGYALPLTRAGYRVFAFEFLGHGRHPTPMSGDVDAVEGTTRLLVRQTRQVIDAVTPKGASVALLGHSMATDILVRAAEGRDDIGPIVLISAFSKEIDATTPRNLLLITGAWEPGLRAFAHRAAQMIAPDAREGETVSRGDILRRTIVAPFSEHVSVLQSRVAREEAVAWINNAASQTSTGSILPTGWAILGLLGGLVALFRPAISPFMPRDFTPLRLSYIQLTLVLIVPMIIAPLVAVPLKPSFLPVLVADYLMLHLLVFGILQITLLFYWRTAPGPFALGPACALLVWCILFGGALDRYVANFWPTPDRLWIIAIMLIGALPYMIADAALTTGTPWAKRLVIRAAFLASLAIAVTLDFEGLFFLIMITPVLILFYAVFGTMGQAAATKSGPLSSGIVLGFVLAWALGVSFPLFQP